MMSLLQLMAKEMVIKRDMVITGPLLIGSMCAGNSTLSWAVGRAQSASGPTSTWLRRVHILIPGRSSTGWPSGNSEKTMIFERERDQIEGAKEVAVLVMPHFVKK